MEKLYEVTCDDGYVIRSSDVNEVLVSAQAHMKDKHHEDLKLDDVRPMVHEVPPPTTRV